MKVVMVSWNNRKQKLCGLEYHRRKVYVRLVLMENASLAEREC
jgi:hypothetical protein